MDTPGVTVDAHAEGVRLRRRAARPRRGRSSRTCACRPRTCCSARAAASRSRRAGSGRAASTTACALIGLAERALEAMCDRARQRASPSASRSPSRARSAPTSPHSRIEIEQARLLTLKAAHMMDTVGNKAARAEIAMIKVVAPNMALRVHRPRDPGPRRRRASARLRPRRRLGARAHAAPRRRARRGPPRRRSPSSSWRSTGRA